MDTGDNIREIRTEFKEYLANKHPEWTEVTVSTRVSDAFYIWNNTVMPGFWKVFVSDESMAVAKENILHTVEISQNGDRMGENQIAIYRAVGSLQPAAKFLCHCEEPPKGGDVAISRDAVRCAKKHLSIEGFGDIQWTLVQKLPPKRTRRFPRALCALGMT